MDARHRYRRAADYIALAQIYLRDNVLLGKPLAREHLKPRLLGHWGTCPGLTLVYSGLNRLVRDEGADAMIVVGPGHGAPAIHANLWLEGTHERHDPALARTPDGLSELVRRFSWPGGFPSHLAPMVPGVIHEGGELGYALATAFGAAFDDPSIVVGCVVGDGEAETGPTAAAWHSVKYLDPTRDGAVLPVLHANGFKITSETQAGSMSDDEVADLLRGCGWDPRIIEITGSYWDDATADDQVDAAFAEALRDIRVIQRAAREGEGAPGRWPAIVLRSPKGWGAPYEVGGLRIEGTFHAHQVPLPAVHTDDEQFAALEAWLRSYEPEALLSQGIPSDLADLVPEPARCLGMHEAANGGTRRRPLDLPELEPYAVGTDSTEGATPVLGPWLRDVVSANPSTFRIVCPDELESNKLEAVLEVTDRVFRWPTSYAEHLGPHGRVMEVLSEHDCQGWLEGYVLTGRHGLFPCYEAFASIVDSMVNQYAKFLKMAGEVPWREPVASLNYLLTSEGWRQEHNGYSHQGPGFINNVLTKKASVARVYLPPDANTLLVTMEHCFGTTDRINVVVAGKNDAPSWTTLAQARQLFHDGAARWDWASTEASDPDVVLACCGNIPTVETLAAAWLLRRDAPELRVAVVNVLDLLSLAPRDSHPHGMSAETFRDLFGDETHVVLDFHGYPSAVHEVLHGRPATDRFHVLGYVEEGTTTTPYDLLALNGVSRHDIAIQAIRRARNGERFSNLADRYAADRDRIRAQLRRDGQDPAEITDWAWS